MAACRGDTPAAQDLAYRLAVHPHRPRGSHSLDTTRPPDPRVHLHPIHPPAFQSATLTKAIAWFSGAFRNKFKVYKSGQKRGIRPDPEAVIGHLKTDGRLFNAGDKINAILAGAGYNYRLVLTGFCSPGS